MTDTTTQEIDTIPVTPNFQVDSGNNLGTEPNRLPPIPSTPVNKDAPAPVPTWSEQVAALRDDFVRGENSSVLLTLVDQEVKRYFAANHLTPTDIDDLAQEVQMKLLIWQRKMALGDLAKDKIPVHFPGFIRRIAHNVLADKYRRQKATFIDDTGTNERYFEQLPDNTDPLDDQIETRLKLKRLQELVPLLTTPQQRILNLRLSGYSSNEIGEMLGMSDNAINVSLNRITKRMRSLLSSSPPHKDNS